MKVNLRERPHFM